MSLCNYGFESYVTKASKVCKRVATKQISRLHKYRRSGFHPTAAFFVHSLCVHSARKETQFVVAFFRSLSAHCQRPSGGGHVAIGRWSLGHRAVFTWPSSGGRWKFREKKRKSQRKERKKQAFIYPIARHLPPHACAKRKSVFSEKSVPQVAQGRMTPR